MAKPLKMFRRVRQLFEGPARPAEIYKSEEILLAVAFQADENAVGAKYVPVYCASMLRRVRMHLAGPWGRGREGWIEVQRKMSACAC